MSQIIKGLWLGSADEAVNKKWLDSKGVKYIVNCAIEHDNYHSKTGKYKYLKLHLDDSPDQKLNYAVAHAFRFIEEGLNSGYAVFVHCHAGISRSASIVIYFLMRKFGGSYRDALELTQNRREQVDPNEGFRYFLENVKFPQSKK